MRYSKRFASEYAQLDRSKAMNNYSTPMNGTET